MPACGDAARCRIRRERRDVPMHHALDSLLMLDGAARGAARRRSSRPSPKASSSGCSAGARRARSGASRRRPSASATAPAALRQRRTATTTTAAGRRTTAPTGRCACALCDGFYFPISDGVRRERLYQRQRAACTRAATARRELFYYPTNGGSVETMVDLDGRPLRATAERVPLSQDAGRGLHVQAGAVVGGGRGAASGLQADEARALAEMRGGQRYAGQVERRRRLAGRRRTGTRSSAYLQREHDGPQQTPVERRRPAVMLSALPAAVDVLVVGELAAAQREGLLDRVGSAADLRAARRTARSARRGTAASGRRRCAAARARSRRGSRT